MKSGTFGNGSGTSATILPPAFSNAARNAALESLPAAQREAFLLQQEAGLSLAEIAELTGAGAETIKSRLRYATAKLRTALEPLT